MGDLLLFCPHYSTPTQIEVSVGEPKSSKSSDLASAMVTTGDPFHPLQETPKLYQIQWYNNWGSIFTRISLGSILSYTNIREYR